MIKKIALPVDADGFFSPHYGESSGIAIFSVDPKAQAISGYARFAPVSDRRCQWASELVSHGVDLMIVGAMGKGARGKCAAAGLSLRERAVGHDPHVLVEAYLQGTLGESAEADACQCGCGDHDHDHHHHHHDHHHGEHGSCGCGGSH